MLSLTRINITGLIWLLLSSWTVFAQVPSPGKRPEKPTLILNATIHDGEGKLIENGFIQINGSTIQSLGTRTNPASTQELASMQVIDAKGKHVYPGFILLNNPLGLNEIDAVRATVDKEETGNLNPNSYSLAAYNSDSDIIPTLRLNGVLMAQISPRGPKFRGVSALVQLDAWNWEDAAVKHRDGMHLKWPSKYKGGGWWAEKAPMEKSNELSKDQAEVKTLFEDAKNYLSLPKPAINTRLEPFRDLFSGKMTLYVHVQYAVDIVSALQYCQSIGVPKVVLITGTQVLQVLDLVKKMNVPVVINRIHSLPETDEESVNLQTRLPYLLKKEGILVALDYEGDMEIMGSRNLGFLAGSAAREGLTKEEALQLITLNPAKMMGVEKQCGSLLPGKDATLFISEGDALDMISQQLMHAWIQGRPIQLESKQSMLYKKFAEKLGQ